MASPLSRTLDRLFPLPSSRSGTRTSEHVLAHLPSASTSTSTMLTTATSTLRRTSQTAEACLTSMGSDELSSLVSLSLPSLHTRHVSAVTLLREHASHVTPLYHALARVESRAHTLAHAQEYVAVARACDVLGQAAKDAVLDVPRSAERLHDATRLLLDLAKLAQRAVSLDGCVHLQRVLSARVVFVGLRLREPLGVALAAVLRDAVGWPCTARRGLRVQERAQVRKVRELFASALLVQLAVVKAQRVLQADDDERVLWVLEQLVQPIAKRFRFHFSGARKTNRPDRPEWYLTFALSAIDNHAKFIKQYLEPIFARSGWPELLGVPPQRQTVRQLLMHGLVDLVNAKLAHDLPRLTRKRTGRTRAQLDAVFRHTIDEVLLFESKLIGQRGFVLAHPLSGAHSGCVVEATLTSSRALLDRWLRVDWQLCSERLKQLLESPSAWVSVDALLGRRRSASSASPSSSLLDLCPTTSADGVVSLLRATTDRFRMIHRLKYRLLFCECIQQRLLEEYLDEMSSLFRGKVLPRLGAKVAPLGRADGAASLLQEASEISDNARASQGWQVGCGMLNSLEFVRAVLEQWSDQLMFLELGFFAMYREMRAEPSDAEDEDEDEDDRLEHEDEADDEPRPRAANDSSWDSDTATSQDILADPRFAESAEDPSTSLFFRVQTRCDELLQTMLGQTVGAVAKSFSRDLSAYQNDSLMWDSAGKLLDLDTAGVDVSVSLAPALSSLKARLVEMARFLSPSLAEEVWAKLTAQLSVEVFRKLISNRHFSAWGARQFAFDMEALFMLFHPFTDEPQNHFKHIRDALILLRLEVPELQRLRSTLEQTSTLRARQALSQFGILVFSVRQVRDMCSRIRAVEQGAEVGVVEEEEGEVVEEVQEEVQDDESDETDDELKLAEEEEEPDFT